MLPVVARAEACTLCSFCVQVCPTRALRVDEDARETRLVLDPAACTGCGKCVRTCDSRALRMSPPGPPILGGGDGETAGSPQSWGDRGAILSGSPILGGGDSETAGSPQSVEDRGAVLRRSPRASCPACGAPTVSRAELAFVAARLGAHPAWLDYCPACRPEYAGG